MPIAIERKTMQAASLDARSEMTIYYLVELE